MKATIPLCFIVAVAYAIAAKPLRATIIDNGELNPRCEKPNDCPGNQRTVFYYNRTAGCQQIRLGAGCSDNGNYQTLDECLTKCAPPPGKQV
uniref:Putative secreted protein n=1 Tax=Ixodes scapularis TaxID=6945 RepID=Q8MVD2_IXOSC|nr:putative secreted protein [Ixodes scapularis]